MLAGPTDHDPGRTSCRTHPVDRDPVAGHAEPWPRWSARGPSGRRHRHGDIRTLEAAVSSTTAWIFSRPVIRSSASRSSGTCGRSGRHRARRSTRASTNRGQTSTSIELPTAPSGSGPARKARRRTRGHDERRRVDNGRRVGISGRWRLPVHNDPRRSLTRRRASPDSAVRGKARARVLPSPGLRSGGTHASTGRERDRQCRIRRRHDVGDGGRRRGRGGRGHRVRGWYLSEQRTGRHRRGPGRQLVVHRVRGEPRRPDHDRRRHHRVRRRHHRRQRPTASRPGPDGNLWFTEFVGDRIGRITPAGVVTEFSAGITPSSDPHGITAGPDGNLWFTESRRRPDRADHAGRGRHRVQRRDHPRQRPAGHHRRPGRQPLVHRAQRRPDRADHARGRGHRVHRRHHPRQPPAGITAGPDGNLWFTELSGDRIGRITPAGVVTEFTAGITPGAARRGSPPGPTATSGSPRTSGTASAGSRPPAWSPSSAPRSPPAAARWRS